MKDSKGYPVVYVPNHPRRLWSEWVWEHLIVAEKALGKRLSGKHPIHHFDENKENNANTNLVICEDEKYHKLLHQRKRILDFGGNPDLHLYCSTCKSIMPKFKFKVSYICVDCKYAYDIKRRKTMHPEIKTKPRRITLISN